MYTKKTAMFTGLAFLSLAAIGIGCSLLWPQEKLIRFDVKAAQAKEKPFTYSSLGAALKFVDAQGMVDYGALKASRDDLDAFAGAIASLKRQSYDGWAEKEKIAFWINAYNGLTLQVVIRNYPIRSDAIRSIAYPSNSIRQIPGAWTKIKFLVMGEAVSLDFIEHSILRKKFNEPRIHLALVCAAVSCPPLRNEPFLAAKLEAQFADQARRFLGDEKKFRIDREEGRVYLSKIFRWFGKDFLLRFGRSGKFGDHEGAQGAVLNFLSRHLPPKDAAYLEKGGYSIEYLAYDWALNEKEDKAGENE